MPPFYPIFRLFARLEEHPFYNWSKSPADGASWNSVCAGLASEDTLTAVILVDWPVDKEVVVRPRGDTAKPIKGREPTANPKTAADMA